jgi:hypothetical protein
MAKRSKRTSSVVRDVGQEIERHDEPPTGVVFEEE